MRPGCCRTHGLTDWALVGVYVRKSKSYTIDEVITVDHLPGNPNQTLLLCCKSEQVLSNRICYKADQMIHTKN